MHLFLTVAFCLFLLFLTMDLVFRFWKLPLLASFAVSLAFLVSYESVILNLLSLSRLVLPLPVLLAHFPLVTIWAGYRYIDRKANRKINFERSLKLIKKICTSNTFYAIVPVLIILLLTALLFPPNTYDSISYHMARVAHWIQRQSIDYYQTSIDRQNVMGPGAEYLILIPQLLSRTDYLANCIQFFSYIALIASMASVIRILKIDAVFRPFIIILSIAAPMAIMQATSTQNDLVAAVMTYAIILTGRRLVWGSIEKFLYRDYALLGACIASGFLVKPTSLIAAFPFLVIGFFRQLSSFIRNKKTLIRCILGGCILVFVIGAISGPDIVRKYGVHMSRPEVYKLIAGWNKARLENPIAMAAHNVPFSSQPGKLLSKLGYHGPFNNHNVFTIHEDLIGNPFQMLVLITLSIITMLFCWYPLRQKNLLLSFFLSLSPLFAWEIFGLIVKDQLWISRLQLPLFFLLPFSFGYVLILCSNSRFGFYLSRILLAGVASFALAYAIIVAGNNPHRHLNLEYFFGNAPDRISSYYNNALREDRYAHQTLLNTARMQGCMKIGLLMGGNSDEYPLIWRLMKEGRQARHMLPSGHHNDQNWPCLYYIDTGQDYRLHGKGVEWLSVDKHTYMRNLKCAYNHSKITVLDKELSNKGIHFFKGSENAALTAGGYGIKVMASNFDPQLFLPKFIAPSKGWLIMKVRFVCPKKTIAQVYYKTENHTAYNEVHSFKQNVDEGENTVYFQIPAEGLKGSLRFDPGNIKGEYIIQSISFRVVSD